MFINLEGALIRKKYIGYAYIYKNETKQYKRWILHVRFMGENQHADYLEFKYETKKEAEEVLKKLEKELED